jgi:hypothetical protein
MVQSSSAGVSRDVNQMKGFCELYCQQAAKLDSSLLCSDEQ